MVLRCLYSPIPQRSRGRLWTVSEFRYVKEKLRASTLRGKIYFRLGEFLRTGKELSSDNQEEGEISCKFDEPSKCSCQISAGDT